MAMGVDPKGLEQAIFYEFKDKTLMENALTHSSFSNECKVKGVEKPCNERLEFLGDAVLQIRVSEYLYEQFPDFAEGILTKMRQNLVCEGTLAKLARSISLGQYLHLGKGEEQTRGRERDSILADAFEALLAAVYLDSAMDAQTVRDYLMRLMQTEIEQCATTGRGGDYKSRLQQLVQQDGDEKLVYVTVAESGPDHRKIFTVEARINSNTVGSGEGHTKREAEQAAAREALLLFGIQE